MNNAAPTTKEKRMEDAVKDISMEERRTYTYPGGSTVTVESPERIWVRSSGAHRIATHNRLHYLAPGFISIEIALRPGKPVAWMF